MSSWEACPGICGLVIALLLSWASSPLLQALVFLDVENDLKVPYIP